MAIRPGPTSAPGGGKGPEAAGGLNASGDGRYADVSPVFAATLGKLAEAIRYAVEMRPEDQVIRMAKLRRTVKEANVYRWAANLVAALSRLPAEQGRRAATA